jgi:hypothetical protein
LLDYRRIQGPDSDPYLILMDPDPDPGGPKTYGSSGSAKLVITLSFSFHQELGEQWVKEGKKRSIAGGGSVEEYKRVNFQESVQLADAFLSYPFLNVSFLFLSCLH